MKTLNVEDLPEQVARALDNMVQTLRHQFRANEDKNKEEKKQPAELPLWPSVAPPPEQFRREEIYKDVC